jgi:hypothetical protein
MISRVLIIISLLLTVSIGAMAQDAARRQLIVPLAEGGFVAFKSETNWTDLKKASTNLPGAPAILDSQALREDNHIIHRVLEDRVGRFVFGYDLWVSANPALKKFTIAVRPLDPQYERKLRAASTSETELSQSEVIATFPKSTEAQTLDDGDAFTLDLLVNQGAGVKIVDVVKVTFDRSNLKEPPRNPARDFTLDAVELAVKDYRLLINGAVAGAGKSTNGCAGALLWFYAEGNGRFIVSLVPREGYEFQKVGVIEDNRIEFTVNNNRYEWLSSSPILSGGGAWNLWVLHDPKYQPIFGADPAFTQKKNVLERLDDMVASAQNASTVRAQSLSAQRNNRDVQKPRTIPLPRVMVGGADRIENLWPKNP